MRNFYKNLKTLILLILPIVGVSNAWGQTYDNGTWYSLYDHPSDQTDGYKNTDKTFDVFAPTSGSCSFEWKKTGYFFGYPGCDIYISQSSDGGKTFGSENHAVASTVYKKQDSWKSESVSVGESINKIKFRQGGTLSRHFKNVTIPLAQHIWVQDGSGTNKKDKMTKSFGSVRWEEAKAITVNFRSFLTNGSITITIEGDTNGDFSFSSTSHAEHSLTQSTNGKSYAVGANMCASANGKAGTSCSTGVLGRASEYDFKVYFYPKKENVGRNYTGEGVYVKITDGTNTTKVFLQGKCVKRGQVIDWDNSEASYNTTGNITYNAVAKDSSNTNNASGINVTYAPTSGSPAYMSGSTLKIVTSGNTTITASAAANTYYNAAPSKSKNITISKVTPKVTWPVIDADLVYEPGEKVQEHWKGGSAKDDKNNSVSGKFECTEVLQPAKNGVGYTATFKPDNKDWYNEASTTLYKDVTKKGQTITWNLDENEEYISGTVFDATATSNVDGLTVTYSIDDPSQASIATISGNVLTVLQTNKKVTVTAHQKGNSNWNPALDVSKEIKTCGAKPNSWSVSAQAIIYGQTLEEATLSGSVYLGSVEIAGSLAWKQPATVPTAGTHNEYEVVFKPNDEDTYGSVKFPVKVVVNKATPVLTWKIGQYLRESSTYNNFVTSSNSDPSATLNISVPNNGPLSVSGNVLTTSSVNGTTSAWIKVSQDATANYVAIPETTLNVTVNPRVNVCLPIVMNESNFNTTIVNSNETYTWYSTSRTVQDTYKVLFDFDVEYSEEAGVGLGSWKDGLSGLTWSKIKELIKGNGGFEWSEKYIDISFTGVPDKVKFSTKKQNLRYNVMGVWYTATVTADTWKVYQSATGETYTEAASATGETSFDVQLAPTTRFVRIEYTGNFTGFVKNLQITQKKSLTADKENLVFGADDKPLQEPQELTVSYSSLGSCALQSGSIAVSTDNPAFYADVTSITENVGIDQTGEYTVRVRCNDLHKSGNVIFTAYDGTKLSVPVSSTNPTITSAGTTVFQTGTEHAPVENTAYREIATHNFASCFNGSTARFDTLYIYGVTESAARLWEMDAQKEYNVPAFTVTDGATAGTAYTPCFVFAKNGNAYEYRRTFDAANRSLTVNAEGKSLWFAGYKPVASTTVQPAIAVSGSADIYLSDVEMNACGAVLATDNAATVTLHARGTNNLNVVGNASAIALDANNTSALVVEDSWLTENSGVLNLNGAASLPTVDLGNAANSMTVNGTQITLKNGTRLAVAYLNNGVEQVNGTVHINDGTILGETELGLPAGTIIDGGTFNDGTVRVYTRQDGHGSLPRNSDNVLLARQTMAIEAVPAGYGKSHLTPDATNKVHPMLRNEAVFEYNEVDGSWETNSNWNKDSKPGKNDIVVVSKNVTVNSDVTVASLTIKEGGSLTIEDGAVVTLATNGYDQLEYAAYGNLIVKKGGRFETNSKRFQVQDFYIESAVGDNNHQARSGQVQDADALVIDGDAYFDLILDQSGECSYGWYDFTVPFPVDNRTGISRFQDDEWKNDLRPEQHYAIMTYYENIRANGQYAWKKYYGIMEPGICYSISVNNTAPLYRFRKQAGAAVSAVRTVHLDATEGTGGTAHKGWNGIGNATLAHASFWAEHNISKIQVFDHKSNAYSMLDEDLYAHIPVGMAIFVQTAAATNMHFDEVVSLAAPMRTQGRTLDEYLLTFTADNSDFTDKLYLSASEDKDNSYQIGHDLSKFDVSTKVAQIWADAYGQKLCDVEAPLVNDQAIIPLSLYAPATASYTLQTVRGPEDASLYLMYEGTVIWNLSQSPYTLDLTRGTATGYSLLLTANAPAVTTGVDALSGEADKAEKIILNGNLYILRDGEMYDATGKKVK